MIGLRQHAITRERRRDGMSESETLSWQKAVAELTLDKQILKEAIDYLGKA